MSNVLVGGQINALKRIVGVLTKAPYLRMDQLSRENELGRYLILGKVIICVF